MDQICFGIDIGGTAVKAGMFDINGKLLHKWSFLTRRSGNALDKLEDAAAFILKIIKDFHLKKENVLGVGVGFPGPVKESGEVLETANLGRGYFNINRKMEEMTGFCTKAGNDANVAAFGEQWKGGGKGCQDMVLITLGTGVGGGIVLNGRIYTGNNGAAGEIGHITVNAQELRRCGCGKVGCLEQYSSATGMVELAKRMLTENTNPSVLRELTEISAKNIFDYAKKEDGLALEIIETSCNYLGLAAAHLSQILDPQVFVIGGGVSKAGEILTKTIMKYHNNYVMAALKNKEFRLAKLGNDAGIYGAARLILDFCNEK